MTTDIIEAPFTPEVTAIEAISRGELDIQITTARNYPRSIGRCIDEARTLALHSQEVAASCLYSLPRGGKPITGGSVRLAEILVNAWEHIRVEGYIVEEGAKHIVARGVCADLQKNTAYRTDVRRRITDKYGKRYNDDMINVTANAAISIAIRNSVFRCIPKAFWEPIYNEARRAAVGDVKSLATRRDGMIQQFAKMGVTKEMLLAKLERQSVEEISLDDVADMIGVFQAVKSGEANIDDVFAAEGPAETPAAGQSAKAKAKAIADKSKKQEAKPADSSEPQPPADQSADAGNMVEQPAPNPEPAPPESKKPTGTIGKIKAAELKAKLEKLPADARSAVCKNFSIAWLSAQKDIEALNAEQAGHLADAIAEAGK